MVSNELLFESFVVYDTVSAASQTMEWRIFIPIDAFLSLLDENSDLRLHVLPILNQFLPEAQEGAAIEERTDDYIITTCDVGVKYRKKSKLEMKIRVETFEGGVEHWVKKQIKGDHPIEAIASYLSSQGYAQTEKIVSMVRDNRTVLINKRRAITSLGSAALEQCEVQVSGSYIQAAMPLRWVSIAVESIVPNAILSAAYASSKLTRLISALVAINKHAINSNIPQLISFVGGYPFFVRYLAGEGTMELADAVRTLEHFI